MKAKSKKVCRYPYIDYVIFFCFVELLVVPRCVTLARAFHFSDCSIVNCHGTSPKDTDSRSRLGSNGGDSILPLFSILYLISNYSCTVVKVTY